MVMSSFNAAETTVEYPKLALSYEYASIWPTVGRTFDPLVEATTVIVFEVDCKVTFDMLGGNGAEIWPPFLFGLLITIYTLIHNWTDL